MSKHYLTQEHQQLLITERISRCAIHAAFFVKANGGDPIDQTRAALHASTLAKSGSSAARAIYLGYRAGINSMKARRIRDSKCGNVIPFRRK